MHRGCRLLPGLLILSLGCAAFLIQFSVAGGQEPEKLSPALSKPVPESLEDLQAIEQQIEKVIEKLTACTVGVRIGRAQGSGVIVSEDGYVLTAAHVSGRPGQNVTLILPDGKQIEGKSLGLNRRIDAGLIEINDKKTKWPFAPMGEFKDVSSGDWCLSLGHPGGYQKGRPPVFRLGRVIRKQDSVIQTDCTLVGGDSGGPLFNMKGEVIGIHSRIGAGTSWNFHVPIQAYTQDWDRLVAGESWGSMLTDDNGAVLGISGEDHESGCRITQVAPNFPAEKAGLQVDDIITRFDDSKISTFEELFQAVSKHKPGDKVKVVILRAGEELVKEATLASRE